MLAAENSHRGVAHARTGRYEGTLIFISHDAHFIHQLAPKVLHVDADQITPYTGGCDYFLEKTELIENERATLTAA